MRHTRKPNIGKHAKPRTKYTKSFATAVRQYANDSSQLKTKARVPFTVRSSTVTRGSRKGEKFLLFLRDGKPRARVYQCCWGYRTNCYKTHIDIYTDIIG